MTICCQCGRHYWPGKNECPSSPNSDGCGHRPCKNCTYYLDEKEKQYAPKQKQNK